MTIRAVSDLTQLSNLSDGDFVGMSHPVGNNGYSSHKVAFKTIEDTIAQSTILSAEEKYKLDGFNGEDVNNKLDILNSIGSVEDRQLILVENPVVTSKATTEEEIPNLGQVITVAQNRTAYVGPNSSIDVTPRNDSGYTEYSDNLMIWQFDHNTKDSTLFKNSYGQRKNPNGIKCTKTGMLTVYGWLADNGNVKAHEAWVGLYGRISTVSTNSAWILLQVQPWILGKNSQVLQYVGFNIPVQAGLELKIMTGFQVNGNNSGLQKEGSLMFIDQGNVVNTFIGYIIENKQSLLEDL